MLATNSRLKMFSWKILWQPFQCEPNKTLLQPKYRPAISTFILQHKGQAHYQILQGLLSSAAYQRQPPKSLQFPPCRLHSAHKPLSTAPHSHTIYFSTSVSCLSPWGWSLPALKEGYYWLEEPVLVSPDEMVMLHTVNCQITPTRVWLLATNSIDEKWGWEYMQLKKKKLIEFICSFM